MSFTYGVMIGWLAPMQPLLQTNYNGTNMTSPLGETAEPLTDEHVSWISGFFCIGGVIGTPLFGYFANKFGRKRTVILAALPFIFAYIMILIADNPYMIFVARFTAGLGGGGVCVIAPMYIGETAEDNIRGVLGSYFNLFICLGIVFSFIVGSYTSYFVLGLVSLVFPTLFLLASIWLPETPIYSLLNNRTEEALNSLIKLRGNHKELIETEMTNLTSSVKEMTSNDEESMSFKDMITEPGTRKALIIGAVVMTVQQFSGISPILNYTVAIFEASGSKLSPNVAAIIVGSLQLIGALAATLFMDRAGRKLLLLISSVGMAMALAPIALYFRFKLNDADPEFMESIGWVPVASMAVYVIVYGLGFGPVPFVLVSEIFTTEARSTATSFCIFLIWGEAFILLKFFASLSQLIGIDSCFGMFSLCCVLGAVFTYYYIPETKGKSIDMILWELRGKQPSNNLRQSPIPLIDVGDPKKEVTKFDFTANEKNEDKV